MNTNTNNIIKLKNGNFEDAIWLNVNPDNEKYNRDNAGDALNRLKKETSLKIDWRGGIVDFGDGECEQYSVEGKRREDVANVEVVFYRLCDEEMEKEENKE